MWPEFSCTLKIYEEGTKGTDRKKTRLFKAEKEERKDLAREEMMKREELNLEMVTLFPKR